MPPQAPGGEPSGLHEAVLDGETHDVRTGPEPELLQNVRAVRLDRFLADEEPPGDFGVGVSESDEADHLALPLAQPFGGLSGGAPSQGGDRSVEGVREGRRDDAAAAMHRTNRINQLGGQRPLQHVSGRPGQCRLARELEPDLIAGKDLNNSLPSSRPRRTRNALESEGYGRPDGHLLGPSRGSMRAQPRTRHYDPPPPSGDDTPTVDPSRRTFATEPRKPSRIASLAQRATARCGRSVSPV